MLVDITPHRDPGLSPILEIISGGRPTQRLAEGVWAWGHWNCTDEIREKMIDPWKLSPRLARDASDEERVAFSSVWAAHEERHHTPARTGVCDSLLDHADYKALIADPERRFTITGVEIRRSAQPESGGWRWHKWGEYIGKHQPQHEYLYYEKDIEAVWTFHIYEHAS